MSTENVTKFLKALHTDPALQSRLDAIKANPGDDPIAAIVQLSVEAGSPVTTEEISPLIEAAQTDELSDSALESVAGGVGISITFDPAMFRFNPGAGPVTYTRPAKQTPIDFSQP